MDYVTRATSRSELRLLAPLLRKLFDIPTTTGAFPVLDALDKLSDVFEGSNYEIVDDTELSPKTMAQCFQNDTDGYTIQIKSSVYEGAYEHNIGAFLGFIAMKSVMFFSFILDLRLFTEEVLMKRFLCTVASNGKRKLYAARS